MVLVKKIPHFFDLFPPEYYHEIQGFDSRLAVLKLNDVRETLGDCALSLDYSSFEAQQNIDDEFERNLIRRIHIRHAIIDLNNCFDLLLQVPWFFYRQWEDFNVGGLYYNSNDKYYKKVIRNTDNWVEKAEKDCNYSKVITVLKDHSDKELNNLALCYKNFNNLFIFNDEKKFTVRTLANGIKHNGSLKIKELCNHWTFNVKENGRSRECNSLKRDFEIFSEDDSKKCIGKTHVIGTDDLYINIKYYDGDLFQGKDCMRKNKEYSLDEIYNELISYYDNLIDVFDTVFNNINPKLVHSEILNPEHTDINKESININKYFIPEK